MSLTPLFDAIAAELMVEPNRPGPCVCDSSPDECGPHPLPRFQPASDWPGDESHHG